MSATTQAHRVHEISKSHTDLPKKERDEQAGLSPFSRSYVITTKCTKVPPKLRMMASGIRQLCVL
jgi:hypothetical protein